MSRLFVTKPRIIEIHWDADATVYTLRLIYGGQYVTPLLTFTPLHAVTVFNRWQSAEIDGWVRLTLGSGDRPKIEIEYCTSRDGWDQGIKTWPGVDRDEFYNLLRELRGGVLPHVGCEDFEPSRAKRRPV